MPECARPGRSNVRSAEHFEISRNHLACGYCCGRDGRTPLTQKFNFGVRAYLFSISNVATMGRWSEPAPQFGIVSAYVPFVTQSRAIAGLNKI